MKPNAKPLHGQKKPGVSNKDQDMRANVITAVRMLFTEDNDDF
jgi:hypothetical protein